MLFRPSVHPVPPDRVADGQTAEAGAQEDFGTFPATIFVRPPYSRMMDADDNGGMQRHLPTPLIE